MSAIREQMGQLIRQRRTQKGLSQEQLGRKLGIGRTTVCRYEAGDQNFTVDTIQKIADALKVKLTIVFE
ncbi:helix-turn-helix domain-containing protein [Spirosoma areae]